MFNRGREMILISNQGLVSAMLHTLVSGTV